MIYLTNFTDQWLYVYPPGEMVATGSPKIKRILETYAAFGGVEDAAEGFAQDLRDIERLASFAETQSVQKMTLEVNW